MTIEEIIKRDNRTWEEMSLRERINIFLKHRDDCGIYYGWSERPCDCGLSMVHAELDKILGG